MLISLLTSVAWAQSGEGYDPENPADPDAFYSVTLEASPKSGGRVSPEGRRKYALGATVGCEAYSKTGYKFKQWMIGDSLVSTNSYFTYTVSAHDEVITAHFDYVGYNPDSPDDPFADGYQHKLTVYSTPSTGGYFNTSSCMLTEGETLNLYAYPNSSFRFVSWKQNGQIVSTQNPLEVKMGEEDLEYTAVFVYDPKSPDDPSKNSFNSNTGELIIDNFVAGSLNDAIYSAVGGYDNMQLVQSLKVIGKMESYDFGYSYNLPNCMLIDLSRTTGYTEIPSWSFESMTVLAKVILPASVSRIGSYAFNGCESLQEIVCYASVPPVVYSDTFNEVPSGVVVRVPASALSLYEEADAWKDFTLLPLDEETCALTVSLPADAIDGRYKNMTLELNNISSGQVLKYLITDRTSYDFTNLVKGTKYNVYVKNESNAVLGSIVNISLEDEDVKVGFESLLQPQTVAVKVQTPEGEDVTSQTQIVWYDGNGEYMKQGAVLTGVVPETKVSYSISLPQNLGMLYVLPQTSNLTVSAEGGNVVYTLIPISPMTISGKVKNLTTDEVLRNATISVSQQLNGKYNKSYIAKTDNNGEYSISVLMGETSLTVSASDFISKTIEVTQLNATVVMEDIALKPISGAVITTNFTYKKSIEDGSSADIQNGYGDYANVVYNIYNVTQDKAVSEYSVQYPAIILLDEVDENDEIRITASSKTNDFYPIEATGVIDAKNRATVTLPIVELGAISAIYSISNNNKVVGILYDENGTLIKKFNYNDKELKISNLANGNYTLVTMANSSLFNSIYSLSQFANSGLMEGTDYVVNSVTVNAGVIASVANEEIPVLDETKLYYTGNNTQFSVNKTSIVAGNYITLKGKVDFKSLYASKVSDVRLVMDIPESAAFVDNSVMIGNRVASYTKDGSRLVIPMDNYNEQVRFCIMPTESGEYYPNAFVQFILDDKEVLQPIGSVKYVVENLSITVPEKTGEAKIFVKGVSMPNSSVKVYDNGILLGETMSIGNGTWMLDCELPNVYSHSYHSIYATITTEAGMTLSTATKEVLYDAKYINLSKINMVFENANIVYDFINPSNKKASYTYPNCGEDFTFLVNFTKNDTTRIKDVSVNVLMMNGKVRNLKAEYNEKRDCWMAFGKFTSSNQLPVSAGADFKIFDLPVDNSARREEQLTNIGSALDSLSNFIDLYSSVDMIEDSDDKAVFNLSYKGTDVKFKLEVEVLDASAIDVSQDFSFVQVEDTVGIYVRNDFGAMSYMATIVEEDKLAAYRITCTIEGNAGAKMQKANGFDIGEALDFGADFFETLTPFVQYTNGVNEYKYWLNRFPKDIDELYDESSDVLKMLTAKCPDGTPKLESGQIAEFGKTLSSYNDVISSFSDAGFQMLEFWNTTLRWAFAFESATLGFGKFLKAIPSAKIFLKNSKNAKYWRYLVKGGKKNREAVEDFIDDSYGKLLDEIEIMDNVGILDMSFMDYESVSTEFGDWVPKSKSNISTCLFSLSLDIKSSYSRCKRDNEEDGDEPDDDSNFYKPYIEPIIDPSGYVYEGVSSNRLEGVTATCYYKETVEDMYGDLRDNIVKWNAEEFAQENPLFTDENGMYAWDVPQGLWQVKFEKEGYETTYSEWLPVPPPQLDVNIAMRQNRQPEVKSARAYEDAIEIEFDKYMQMETLNADNIFLTKNGEMAEGEVKLMNEEAVSEGSSVKYASKLRFIPVVPLLTTDEVRLTISHKVTSYAGIQMSADYTQDFDIEKEVKSLVVEEKATVGYEKSRVFTVSALPYDAAIGKKLVLSSSSSMILSLDSDTLTLDDKGQATFTANGELPGSTVINYHLIDTEVMAKTEVEVWRTDIDFIEMPYASRATGTALYRGSTIELSCLTEDVVIYYTLDGSCPCDENGTRMIYDAPIVIDSDNVTIKALAVDKNGVESEIADFVYRLKTTSVGLNMVAGWNWISHNQENGVSVDDVKTNTNRIVSQTAELVNDPNFGYVGSLALLNPYEMYKVEANSDFEHMLAGYEHNPSNPISLKSGWNWLGFPVNQTLTVAEAFDGTEPDEDDIVVGQYGFAQFVDGTWVGTLRTMTPGLGYMYHSKSDKELVYNTSLVSKAKAVFAAPLANNAPWAVDVHQYPNVMCVVANVYKDGIKAEEGEYHVGAFCGTECRGVGRYVDGLLMMSVYGNGGEDITFVAIDANDETIYNICETAPFAETMLGGIRAPYEFNIGSSATSIADIETGMNVWPVLASTHIYVSGKDNALDKVTITDINGSVVAIEHNVESGGAVNVSNLSGGMYIVTVYDNRQAYYKKIVIQ